jgi:glyoxylase-like metal-dependent hydrolase (beta-lactamase superfamily II)
MTINESIYYFENIKGANSYLFVSDQNEVSIIDTGFSGNGYKIMGQINELGISPERIKFIILTHSDMDHIGSVLEIKKATGAKVAIHEKEVSYLSGEKKKKRKGIFGLFFGILTKFIKTPAINADIKLNDGDYIGGLKVIHCPGHTEGSISLYKEENILFSGDAIITDKSSNIKGFSKAFSSDLNEASNTIKKITLLKFDVLLPGHGNPVLKNASDKLKEFNC